MIKKLNFHRKELINHKILNLLKRLNHFNNKDKTFDNKLKTKRRLSHKRMRILRI